MNSLFDVQEHGDLSGVILNIVKAIPPALHTVFLLAPMEDVTDLAFRKTLVKFGSIPHVFMTEFTNVEGLSRSLPQVYRRVLTDSKIMGVPVFVQLWGKDLHDFYDSTIRLLKMGYWGIDLNMGCPVKNVIKKGLGAGLHYDPQFAKDIIFTVHRAINEFTSNSKMLQTWQDTIKENIKHTLNFIKRSQFISKEAYSNITSYLNSLRDLISISRPSLSVKTRITQTHLNKQDHWLTFLAQQPIDMLTIHLRTIKQLSQVPANWGLAKHINAQVKDVNEQLILIGNGDVTSVSHGLHLAGDFNGIMIGRGIFKNPLLFRDLWLDSYIGAVQDTKQHNNIDSQFLYEMYLYHIKQFKRLFKTSRIINFMQSHNIMIDGNIIKKISKYTLIKNIETLKKFAKVYVRDKKLRQQILVNFNKATFVLRP